MQWTRYINVILWLVAMNLCFAQQTADRAANGKTKQLLAYITDLPRQGI